MKMKKQNIVQDKIEEALRHWEKVPTNINLAFHRGRVLSLIQTALSLAPDRAAVSPVLTEALFLWEQMLKLGRRTVPLNYTEVGNLLREALLQAELLSRDPEADFAKNLMEAPVEQIKVYNAAEAKEALAKLLHGDDGKP